MDHYSDRSTVDSRPGQGGTLISAWHAAATEGRSSPREHQEKKGVEGNLTVAEGGGAARGWSEAGDEEQWRRRLKLDRDGV
jgi:hypothetical protein